MNLNNATGIEGVIGTAGADIIRGNNRANVLIGGAGADTLFGFGGDDVLYANSQSVFADGAQDDLFGGDGMDTAGFDQSEDTITNVEFQIDPIQQDDESRDRDRASFIDAIFASESV